MKNIIQSIFIILGIGVMATSYTIGVPNNAGVTSPYVWVPALTIALIVVSYVLIWNKWFRTKKKDSKNS